MTRKSLLAVSLLGLLCAVGTARPALSAVEDDAGPRLAHPLDDTLWVGAKPPLVLPRQVDAPGGRSLSVPVLCQRDGRWANELLGFSGTDTIGYYGCALTAAAMMLRYYGCGTDPHELNQWLKNNGGYVSGDLIVWGPIAGRQPGVSYVGRNDWQSVAADLSVVNSELDAGYPVITEVRLSGSMHFVVITGRSGSTYNIADPWYGDQNTIPGNHYTKAASVEIYGIRKYHGSVAYTLATSAGGGGSVSGSQTVNRGDSPTFYAYPDAGYAVEQWLVDGGGVQAGGNQYTLGNVQGNHSVQVTFARLAYDVSTAAGQGGGVSGGARVYWGDSPTFYAYPSAGYVVAQWLVDGGGAQDGGAQYTLGNVRDNHAVQVTFRRLTYLLSTSAGTGGGVSGSTWVNWGDSPTFTASPNAGYAVAQWLLDGGAVQAGGTQYTLGNVQSNHSVQVTFARVPCDVSTSAGPGGSVSGGLRAYWGDSPTFTATPDTGYAVDQWLLDGTVVQSGGTDYTLRDIQAAHSVQVTFRLLLDPSASTVTVSPATQTADGAPVLVTVALRTATGSPVAQQPVTVATSLGSVVQPAVTDVTGQTVAQVSATTPGTATLTVTAAGLELGAHPVVTFVAPPAVTLPSYLTTATDTPLTFTGDHAVTVAAPSTGASPLRLTLFGGPGTLRLSRTTGLTFPVAGHANGSSNIVCQGPPAALNAALDGLKFTPRARFAGLALVQATADDLGGTGLGRALRTTATVRVWVAGRGGSVVGWGDNASRQCAPPASLLNAVAVAGGLKHSLALRADQTVAAWGGNGSSQCSVPAGLGGVLAVAAGYSHSLALRSDGTVVAWGGNSSGQATVPAGLTDVVAIAAGWAHSAALKGNGQVVCWGHNGFAQSSVPATLGPVAGLAAGGYHTLALRADGTVAGWGENRSHQVDAASGVTGARSLAANETCSLALVSDGSVVSWGGLGGLGATRLALAAAGRHALALNADGTVTSLGDNLSGESTPPAGLSDVVAVGAGVNHSLAVQPLLNRAPTAVVPGNQTCASGASLALGRLSVADPDAGTSPLKLTLCATHGTLTFGSTTGLTFAAKHGNGGASPVVTGAQADLNAALATLTFTPTAGFAGLALVQATLDDQGNTGRGGALRATNTVRVWVTGLSGSVVAWGDNGAGQCTPPAGLTGAVAVAGGQKHSLALRADGSVVAWGSNANGQRTVPAGLTGVVAVAAGYSHSLALKGDGTVVAWGSNSQGQCTVPATLTNVVALAAGWAHSAALRADGTVVCWGHAKYGQCAVPATLGAAAGLAAGAYHTLALRPDGTVVGWGQNGSQQVTGASAVVDGLALAGADSGSLALLTDGSAVGWGTLGGSAGPLTAVAAGGLHAVGLLADGTVVAWGSLATVPAGLAHVLSVGAGTGHNLAVQVAPNGPPTLTVPGSQVCAAGARAKLAGCTVSDPDAGTDPLRLTVFATNGTVALGSATGLSYAAGHANNSANPQVSGVASSLNTALTGLTFTPTTGFAGLALVQLTIDDQGHNGYGGPRHVTRTVRVWVNGTGGSVTLWGDNTYRQLTPPTGLTNAVALAAGLGHTLALRADQTVVGWGNNGSGQRTVPAGLTGVVAVAAGYSHSLALRADGTVVAWGANGDGQATVPASLSDVVAIAAGWAHSVALRGDGTVVCWGNNKYGQSAVPTAVGVVAGLGTGGYHTLALRHDGTVTGWGQNAAHQVDGGAGQSGLLAVTGSASASLGLKSDGSVVAWGSGLSAPSGTFTAVAALDAHGVGLCAGRAVVCFGGNAKGEGTAPTLARVLGVAAGQYHSAAIYDSAAKVPAPSVLSVRLTTSPVSPVVVGTEVTLTATLEAPAAGAEYQFLVSSDGGKTFETLQDWSTEHTADWAPGVAGGYQLRVNVRAAGATASASGTVVVSAS